MHLMCIIGYHAVIDLHFLPLFFLSFDYELRKLILINYD